MIRSKLFTFKETSKDMFYSRCIKLSVECNDLKQRLLSMSEEPVPTSYEFPSKSHPHFNQTLNQSSIATFSTSKHTPNQGRKGVEDFLGLRQPPPPSATTTSQNLMSIQQADYLEKTYMHRSTLSEQHLIELELTEVSLSL